MKRPTEYRGALRNHDSRSRCCVDPFASDRTIPTYDKNVRTLTSFDRVRTSNSPNPISNEISALRAASMLRSFRFLFASGLLVSPRITIIHSSPFARIHVFMYSPCISHVYQSELTVEYRQFAGVSRLLRLVQGILPLSTRHRVLRSE